MGYFIKFQNFGQNSHWKGISQSNMTKDFFSFYSRIFIFPGIHSNSQPEAETEPEEEDI